jgi:hypothetical protein
MTLEKQVHQQEVEIRKLKEKITKLERQVIELIQKSNIQTII